MDKQTYSLKGKDGATVERVFDLVGPGVPPPPEAVQKYYEAHGFFRRGSVSVPGYAQLQTERKDYALRGVGGKGVVLTLDKVSAGEFPPLEKVQKWYQDGGFPTHGECAVAGSAACLIAE